MDVAIVRALALPLLIAIFLITACAPQQPSIRPAPPAVPRTPLEQAEALVARGESARAAQLLEAQAHTASAEDQPALLLLAAELRLDMKQTDLVERALTSLDEEQLDDEGHYRKALLDIRLLVAEGQAATAAVKFSELATAEPGLRPQWLKAEAEIATATGNPLDAARARAELNPLLPEGRLREDNQQFIWDLLVDVPIAKLRSLMPPPPDEFGAWLELAFLTRSHRLEPDALEEALQQWHQRYPEHPAGEELADELLAYYRQTALTPDDIAVLLPLTGKLGDSGKAVLDGFLAGYYAADDQRPKVTIYDVGDDPAQALAAYQEAVNAGSDFVVGPLTKESLIMLASAARLTAPVLALNTLPGGENPVSSMYQFALAPEDEAVAAADYAMAQGLQRALVLVPEDDWGDRVAAAFSDAFERRGGMVLETAFYDSRSTDFSTAITALFNLDASAQRARRLRQVTKRSIKVEPQRRQDVDVIFVGAFSREARLIRPQLRFFDAIDVPVIATSHAYGGHRDAADKDLSGVSIVDMPWLLRDGTEHALDRKELQQLREAALQYPRLYAFGIDAYRLARYLPLLRRHQAESMEGYTGILSLDAQGRVHRRLYPARFRGDSLHPVGDAAQRAFGFMPIIDDLPQTLLDLPATGNDETW